MAIQQEKLKIINITSNIFFLLEATDYFFQPAKSSLQSDIFAGYWLLNVSLLNEKLLQKFKGSKSVERSLFRI